MQKVEIIPLAFLKQQGDDQFPSDSDDLFDQPQASPNIQCTHQIIDFLKNKNMLKNKNKSFLGIKMTDQLYQWNTYLIHKFDVHHKK